ncbi:restriction endonuclease subunit S [Prevotellaceae bacterium LCP21S3_C11]
MMEPKIRFKGFEGEWKTSTIGEIAPLSGGYAFQSNHFSSVGIPIVRISNILETGIVGGVFAKYATFDGDADFRLYDGDAVIAMSGATTGKVAIVHTQGFLYQNQRVGKFTKTDRVIYDFLTTIVKSHKFRADLSCLLTSSAQPNASSKDIDSITQSIPLDKDEQQVIGKYFTSLDSQIYASTSRLASLKQMKAASLQAMFPQEGETVPKIRFKGFEGEWKKVKLNECLEISKERNINGEYGINEVLSVSDEEGVMNQIKLLGRSFAGKSVTNYKVLRTNQVVYTKSPLKAKPYGIIKVNKGDTGIVSVLYAVYDVKVNTNPDYIHYYFDPTFRINSYLLPLINKGAKNTMNISDEVSLQGYISLPSLSEQQAIASYFTSLDRQISLQSQRLEKLKQIKSACLDKMFV